LDLTTPFLRVRSAAGRGCGSNTNKALRINPLGRKMNENKVIADLEIEIEELEEKVAPWWSDIWIF
jgi:hypothetical protein